MKASADSGQPMVLVGWSLVPEPTWTPTHWYRVLLEARNTMSTKSRTSEAGWRVDRIIQTRLVRTRILMREVDSWRAVDSGEMPCLDVTVSGSFSRTQDPSASPPRIREKIAWDWQISTSTVAPPASNPAGIPEEVYVELRGKGIERAREPIELEWRDIAPYFDARTSLTEY